MNENDLLASRLLLVDDEPANLRLLEDLLAREGFLQVVSTTEPDQVLQLVQAYDPDLILLDLMMPVLDGYAVLEQLQRQQVADEFRPVLVLTADATRGACHRALALGARDFLTKPFDPVEALLRIWNLLETRQLHKRLRALGQPASDLSAATRRMKRGN